MQCKWVPHSQERWTTFCGLPLTSTVNHGSASGKRQNANSSLSKVIKVPFFQTFTAEKRDINRSSKNQPSLWISLWDLTAPLSKFDNRDWTRSTTSSCPCIQRLSGSHHVLSLTSSKARTYVCNKVKLRRANLHFKRPLSACSRLNLLHWLQDRICVFQIARILSVPPGDQHFHSTLFSRLLNWTWLFPHCSMESLTHGGRRATTGQLIRPHRT